MDPMFESPMVWIAIILLDIWALWDLFTSHREFPVTIGWLLFILIAPFLGAIYYLLTESGKES